MKHQIKVSRLPKTVRPLTIEKAAGLLEDIRTAELEILKVIHVQRDLAVREVQTVGIGSMMSVAVESRNIFSYALMTEDPGGVIVAHNHAFQRKAEPSVGDREFISSIIKGGDFLGVPVIDSLDIGTDEYYSFVKDGLIFPKRNGYEPFKVAQPNPKGVSYRVDTIKIDKPSIVSTPAKALSFLEPILGRDGRLTAVMHLTPSLEPTMVDVYPSGNPADMVLEEIKNVFRRAISSPSTKYLILATNHGQDRKRPHMEPGVMEWVNYFRLTGIVLCMPVLDALILGGDMFSFMMNGKHFPRGTSYTSHRGEGMKMKGPSKTSRADLPPYGWHLECQ